MKVKEGSFYLCRDGSIRYISTIYLADDLPVKATIFASNADNIGWRSQHNLDGSYIEGHQHASDLLKEVIPTWTEVKS